MEIFKYIDRGREMSETTEIYSMVYENSSTRRRAYNSYKGIIHPEDVLDNIFEAVMERYNKDIGPIENFTNSTLKNIDKNTKRNELNLSEGLDPKMENAQKCDNGLWIELPATKLRGEVEIPMNYDTDDLKNWDIVECMNTMESVFVNNIFYMLTKTGEQKIINFKEDFAENTVKEAQSLLLELYGKKTQQFFKNALPHCSRSFSLDKYKNRFDTSVEYRDHISDIYLIMRQSGSHKKIVYSIDIPTLVYLIYKEYYEDPSKGYALKLGYNTYYVTLSGRLVDNKEELFRVVGLELVNQIVTKLSMNVLRYEDKDKLLLVTTKVSQNTVSIKIFDDEVTVRIHKELAAETI